MFKLVKEVRKGEALERNESEKGSKRLAQNRKLDRPHCNIYNWTCPCGNFRIAAKAVYHCLLISSYNALLWLYTYTLSSIKSILLL